jgi:hypothetical protein
MLKKIVVGGVMVTFIMLGPAAKWSRAQDSAAPKAAAEAEPGHAYRLDFTLSETEDGKKINSRQYAMSLGADTSEIKIGTRVPVEVKQGEIQYLDVGTSIWCRLRDRRDVSWLGNDVLLNIRSDLSSFAVPDQQNTSMRPAIRQMKIDASMVAFVGKQMVVGIVDDPNSKRQYQLDITVTRLK